MRETWYVLEDGSVVDPNEVAPDDKGVLRHSNGGAVAMRGQTPSSRGVDAAVERAKANPKSKSKARDMKPEESVSGYTTREAKAE